MANEPPIFPGNAVASHTRVWNRPAVRILAQGVDGAVVASVRAPWRDRRDSGDQARLAGSAAARWLPPAESEPSAHEEDPHGHGGSLRLSLTSIPWWRPEAPSLCALTLDMKQHMVGSRKGARHGTYTRRWSPIPRARLRIPWSGGGRSGDQVGSQQPSAQAAFGSTGKSLQVEPAIHGLKCTWAV